LPADPRPPVVIHFAAFDPTAVRLMLPPPPVASPVCLTPTAYAPPFAAPFFMSFR